MKSGNCVRFRHAFGMIMFTMAFGLGAQAQQIDADVNVMLERLPLEKQERLKNFAGELETYLGDYDWTGEDLANPIPVKIQIFLQDVSVSYEDRYSGTFLISNSVDIQYYDKYWKFPKKDGDPLIHQDNIYHPLTGFLDFYVYLLLAGKYDEFGKYEGQIYFEKAKQIANQGLFDAQFSKGWKERNELIDYLMSDEYKPYRAMKDLFFLGLSYQGEDEEQMLKYCEQAIGMLETIMRKDPEHDAAEKFISAYYMRFIELFKEKPDVLRRLIRLDPEHEGAYRQYLP